MGTINYWRDYFRTAKADVFDVIEHAILVAATDYPKEFRLKRDKIAETLFSSSCKTRCSGCDHVDKNNENAVSNKVCSKVIDGDDHIETKFSNNSLISPSSSDDAEDLVDEIEEQHQVFEEILRIKQILDNSHDETSSVLFESLRRLQLMALTVETLKESEIGKSVSRLRKHTSKDIRNLAKTLIDIWKQMVDEWVIAREALAITASVDDGTPNSNPSGVDDEEGLPSPPLDEAFFAIQPISMELTRFFDGMDDDGNRPNHRRPSMNNRGITKAPNQEKAFNETKVVQQVQKQEAVVKPMSKVNKPLNGMQQRVNNEVCYPQKPDKGLIQNGTRTPPQYKTNCVDDVKLEAAKRKLQQNYQQIENAKRQRTIQVMEINELPKQGLGHKNAYVKSSGQSRRINGRR